MNIIASLIDIEILVIETSVMLKTFYSGEKHNDVCYRRYVNNEYPWSALY